MRPDDAINDLKPLCEGTAVGAQSSAITNAASQVLIGSSLKGAEAKFADVEVKGTEGDTGLYCDPFLVLSNDGGLKEGNRRGRCGQPPPHP